MTPERRARARSERTLRLTQGPIASTLASLALPMVVAMIAMVGFNLIDTYFVGQLGTAELAAISFTFPVVLVITSVTMGIGIGATSTIARAIGEGDHHRITRLTTDAIALGLAITVFFVALGLATINPLFRLLGADDTVLPLIREYMFIWYLGVPAVVIPQIGNSAIRATGDTKTTAVIMLLAMFANLVLDPILIFGLGPAPALGISGAAIATVAARVLALALSAWVLGFRERMLTFARPILSEVIASWRAILSIGLPASLTQIIVPVSTGVIPRLEMFAVFTVTALGSVLIPFVGQNWGAGHGTRALSGVKVARRFALGWGALMWILALAFGRPIVGQFNADPFVIRSATEYLWIVGATFGLQGLVLVGTSAFNAIDKPLHSMTVSLLRMFVLYVPLALVGSALLGLSGIWWAAAAANAMSGIMSVVWFDRTLHSLARSMGVRLETKPAPSVA